MNHVAPTLLSATSAADQPRAAVSQWLGHFEAALGANDKAALAALFAPECHLRDLLAFSWTIKPAEGVGPITEFLTGAQPTIRAKSFAVADRRTAPRRGKRLGIEVFEGIFRFETALGRGHGVVRLLADDPGQAWVLLTSLDELKGHEEKLDANRPSGSAYSRNFGGENWLDQRNKARAFADRDPVVLVVGGGQSGLAIAARLREV